MRDKTVERQTALDLYLNGITITVIAEMLDLSIPTISNWKKDYKWDEIRSARTASPYRIASNILKTIEKLSVKIEGDDNADSNDVKMLSDLSDTYNKIVGEDNVKQLFSFSVSLMNYMLTEKKEDCSLSFVKKVQSVISDYITDLIKRNGTK